MSTTDRIITIRPIGDGPILLKSWKGNDGYPIYLEEKEGMSDAQKERVVRSTVTKLPIGKKKLTSAWGIPTKEVDLINALKQHPFCSANPKCHKPQFMLIDHYEDMEKEENFAALRFTLQESILKLKEMDLKGFCTVVGIPFNEKTLSVTRAKVQDRFIESTETINSFLEHFDIETNTTGIKSIKLKDHYRMQAFVIAGINQGALTSEKGTGTIMYKSEVIGLNIEDAATNLSNNSENGKGKFLPLIKQALSGKK